MSTALNDRLHQLRGTTCTGVDSVVYEERPADPTYSVGTIVSFSDTTRLSAQFWRLIKNGKPLVSIFDHRQKYGLPEPIDAIHVLEKRVARTDDYSRRDGRNDGRSVFRIRG